MYDMLPFPNITATTAEEQVSQINNYLIQFKETLEFILTNISVDNLSQELIDKLNSLGSDIKKSYEQREEEIQQVSGKMLSVSDVINSSIFQKDMEEREADIMENMVQSTEFQEIVEAKLPTTEEIVESMNLRVNYDTGHLEY